MKIQTVWSVWFSATGTTERTVRALADTLGERLGAERKDFSFNLPEAREKDLTFGPEDLVVMGVPVYAGRVPNLLLPYIRDRVKGDRTPAVCAVLFGNRNFDDGLIELRNVMTENGFMPLAGAAVAGEHAFSRVLGAGRPDSDDMALVQTLAERTAEKIRNLDTLPEKPVEVEGCDPLRPYYTPRDRNGEPIRDFLKAKPAVDPARCTRCGLCARLCPLGSIDPEDVTRVGRCFKCCACVKNCPAGARYFDHAGYLYHQHELEEMYAGRRADTRIFV